MNKKPFLISLVFLLLVIPCVVSADTLIVYPSDNARVYTGSNNMDYFWHRDGTGAGRSSSNPTQDYFTGITATTTTNNYQYMSRGVFTFNTSVIGSGKTISSAKFSVYTRLKNNALGSPALGLTGVNLTTNGSVVYGDYQRKLGTRYSTDIPYNDVPSGFSNFSFNSNGLNAISPVSWTNIMLRDSFDIDNQTPTWSSGGTNYYYGYYVGASSEYKPFLEIVYSAGVSAPVASFTTDHTSVCQQDPIQFTDQSTNTPTGWYWDFGDTSTNTTQNPIYRYSTNGLFTVKLKATNSFGFDWENKTDYIGVGDWGSCVDEGETCIA